MTLTEALKRVRDSELPVVLSLFDLSGNWAEPWTETHMVVLQDEQHPAVRFRSPRVLEVGGDIHDVLDTILSKIGPIDVILAAPPCTCFCRPSSRLWGEYDKTGKTEEAMDLVRQALKAVWTARPRVWALENPPGRLANKAGTGLMQGTLGFPDYEFDPCDHGDPKTKHTYLWGRFETPLWHPVKPEAFPDHLPAGRRDATSRMSSSHKNERAKTPLGFAKDFYAANRIDRR